MDEYNSNRIKSAMIVYALEQSLGKYILGNKELSESISTNKTSAIIEREDKRGNKIQNDIELLVESSYLSEVFGFAMDISKSSSMHSHLKALENMCSQLNLFDIRNAISHPNRPFPECYWYRSAAIASDPLIEKINLSTVTQALRLAESGQLDPPPDEWFNDVLWEIPNSLPSNFDHDITGLLGRDKEINELGKIISIPRNNLIAIVAPGGVGKTALILQYLKDLSLSLEATKFVSAISFTTLKNEILTTSGIQKVDAIQTIEQMKEKITQDLSTLFEDNEIDSFESAVLALEDQKILLCIDNLETILMESPQSFIEFNQQLPLSWRVIVTSRVTVDSSITIPLETLKKSHSAFLARNYLKKKGVFNTSEKDISEIVSKSANNPLAIRLIIDLFLKGKQLPDSTSESQKEIASFSYRNLINALSDTSVSVLEAIFAQGESTRSDLCETLEIPYDEIVQAVLDLSKTSLISRITSEDEEKYALNISIRDFLISNPKNMELRKAVAEKITNRNQQIQDYSVKQQQTGMSKFHEGYIPSSINSNVKALAIEVDKHLKKRKPHASDISSLQKRLLDSEERYSNDYFFHYTYSRFLVKIGDSNGWKSHLNQAINLNPSFIVSKSMLAWNLFCISEYQESENIYSELIKDKWDDPSNSDLILSKNVLKGYLQTKISLGKFDEVIELTANWENATYHNSILGTYRAASLKRSVEHLHSSNPDKSFNALNLAIVTLSKVYERCGYSANSSNVGIKVIKDIYFMLSSHSDVQYEFVSEYLDFIAKHMFNIIDQLYGASLEDEEIQKMLVFLYELKLPKNPLHAVTWYNPKKQINYDENHIQSLIHSGYTIVAVSHVPQKYRDPSSYMFAIDEKGKDYYLNIENFNGGWEEWSYIEPKTKLAIKFKGKSDPTKACPATEIQEIKKNHLTSQQSPLT